MILIVKDNKIISKYEDNAVITLNSDEKAYLFYGKLEEEFEESNKVELDDENIESIEEIAEFKGFVIPELSKLTEVTDNIQITNFIYKYYPQDKQNSDIADKMYYETVLRAKGFENLDLLVSDSVKAYLEGTTIEELVADLDEEDKVPAEQLLKVGIRVTWVQMCKAELALAIAEERTPVFPAYPL